MIFLLLLLLQPTQMKFKQKTKQKKNSPGMKEAPKGDKLHAYMPHIYMFQLTEILPPVAHGP